MTQGRITGVVECIGTLVPVVKDRRVVIGADRLSHVAPRN